jgi:hypothetical protein
MPLSGSAPAGAEYGNQKDTFYTQEGLRPKAEAGCAGRSQNLSFYDSWGDEEYQFRGTGIDTTVLEQVAEYGNGAQ